MEVEILSVQQYPSAQKDRIGQMDTFVLVRIDGKRTDSFLFPYTIIDPAELERAINNEVKTRSALIGHKFSIA